MSNGPSSPALLIYDPVFLEHRMEGHPERPERLTSVMRALDAVPALQRVSPRPAAVEELRLVHTAAHVERVEAMATGGGGWVDPDTYVTPRSFDAARLAAGALLTDRARRCLFPVRPG